MATPAQKFICIWIFTNVENALVVTSASSAEIRRLDVRELKSAIRAAFFTFSAANVDEFKPFLAVPAMVGFFKGVIR